MKPRILFVDDVAQVLDGLRYRLRRQRKNWEMAFATSGREALLRLEAEPFDVVVTDMRMPEMDGVALLTCVRERFPAAVRIVLSGHADRDLVASAVPVAHQFLTKPCDPGVLENALEHACRLSTTIPDPEMRDTVGRLNGLPPAPRVYSELVRILQDDRTNNKDVAALMERDPALAARILQIVNSGFVRLARSVDSIADAVGYLGTNHIKHMVLAVEVFRGHDAKWPAIPVEDLQSHGELVGRVAARFFTDQRRAEAAHLAGLLHDVGRLVLAVEYPRPMAEAIREARDRGLALRTVETKAFGVDHGLVGGHLLGMWGLPRSVVEAVTHHHTPALADPSAREITAAVHVADTLVRKAVGPQVAGSAVEAAAPDLDWMKAVGLGSHLPVWRQRADELLAIMTP